MLWAAPYSASDATNDKQITAATEALHRHDVVWVQVGVALGHPALLRLHLRRAGEAAWIPEQLEPKKPPKTQELALEQMPRVEGSLYAFDHRDGYVLAMAGGDDFDRSEFNRVTQACRQPGSAFKPIYYSLALDRGYAYDTVWNDKLKAEIDPTTGELWIPQNVDGSYNASVSLERALVWSKNPPSVEIFHILGAKDVERWARRLGITTPLITNAKCEKEFCSSLALGASCVHMDDMTRAFAVFARNGRPQQPVMVRRVIDRKGHVLVDNTAWDDPWLDGDERLDRVGADHGHRAQAGHRAAHRVPHVEAAARGRDDGALGADPRHQGASPPARPAPRAAPATSGSSATPRAGWRRRGSATITYERQLGYKDASFMLSVPMWARFIYAAAGDQPLEEIPWERPSRVKANDIGGPLKKEYPPPPPPGFDVTGKPIEPPEKLKEQLARSSS